MTVMNNLEPRLTRNAPVDGVGATGLQLQDGGSEPLISQYLRILLRWRWLVLGSIVTTLAISVVATLLMTRMYSASVTLEIAREEAKVVNIQSVEPQAGTLDQEFYQTQYGLLKSRSLGERVAKELSLAKDSSFLERYGIDDSKALFSDNRVEETSTPAQNARFSKVVDVLLSHVDISPVRASRLATVTYSSPDPELSARIANSWTKDFIESNIERKFEATAYARRFLEGRLEQVRQRLDESERNLVSYAAANRIITLGSATAEGNGGTRDRSIATDNLIFLNEALSNARADRIATASRLQNLGRSGATPEGLTNPAIASIRQKRAEVAADYAKLEAQFQPSYPPARALAAQLRELDAGIAREETRVRDSISNQYKAAVGRESELASRVQGLESGVIDQRRRGIQYNIFQRDVDTNRQLYDGLLQRYKEIGVAGGVGTNNVSIVDAALPPEKPSHPRPTINLLLGLLSGLVVGVGLAFALEQIDEAIADPTDLEKALRIPALGTIPMLAGQDPIDALQDRKTSISEAYLSVETSLKFSTAEGLPKTLVVTSTRPGEGKSTSSFAIALSMARLGHKTLLIDADMRSPSIHGYLNIPNSAGLSDILSGNGSLDDLIKPGPQAGLFILLAGTSPPNAAELLSGVHLDETIRDALQKFNNIVFDAPPVMGLADAPLIASKSDGTILVVESHGARSRQVQISLGRLQNARASVLGAILTKFEQKRVQFGYGYDYGYGYGEGSQANGDR